MKKLNRPGEIQDTTKEQWMGLGADKPAVRENPYSKPFKMPPMVQPNQKELTYPPKDLRYEVPAKEVTLSGMGKGSKTRKK